MLYKELLINVYFTYIYIFKQINMLKTLEKFVSFNQSVNEIKYKLEQLRALDNEIKINVALANLLK